MRMARPAFCMGCVNCVLKGENFCKDAGCIQKIEDSLLEAVLTGAKSAAKDIWHSLSWWGISEIHVFAEPLMEDFIWEKLVQDGSFCPGIFYWQ